MVNEFKVGDYVWFNLSNTEARTYARGQPTCADPFVITEIKPDYGNDKYAMWDCTPFNRACPGAYLKWLEHAEGPW